MKRILLAIILLVALSIVLGSEIYRTDQVRKVLDSFMDSKPKELFKIWHLLYRREYTFNSEEAKIRFINFFEVLILISWYSDSCLFALFKSFNYNVLFYEFLIFYNESLPSPIIY